MSPDAEDTDTVLNPGAARARDRERQRRDRLVQAWAAIRKCAASPPADLAGPPEAWRRELADAIDSVLYVEWPDEDPSPDGVGDLLLSATERGFEVDALLYLLPSGTRRLRVQFDGAGHPVIRVAVPGESDRGSRRLDPRREMRWAFEVKSPDVAG